MIDWSNRVLSNVAVSVSDLCKNVTATNSDNPPDFPCLAVSQIDNPDIAEDLENTENAVESVIELQAYSNKNLTEARKIINTACDAMRQMGYRRRMGPNQVKNVAGKNIFRMIARFSRVIGVGEEIKRFDSR